MRDPLAATGHFQLRTRLVRCRTGARRECGPLALKIVGDGAATATFKELSERSSRVANGLRALGVKRGERILLMLGNVVPLWEVMLAAMKLGGVVIPASTLLTPTDLKDRFERGRVRHLIAYAADAQKFAGLDPTVTRIAVGDAPAGWHSYEGLLRGDARFTADGETRPPIRCCCISPPAPRRGRSWWSTVTIAIRLAT
jgi:acetyl-CoA synthetase